MKPSSARFIARAAIIASIYAVITVLLAPISYGQLQIRLSEMLTPLAYFDPAAILGLYAGAIIANFFSPFGIIDILFGSFLTLIAAVLTYLLGRFFKRYKSEVFRYLGPAIGILPVVLINAFGVAYILNVMIKFPYLLGVFYVGAGEAIAVYGFGYPFLLIVMKLGIYEV